MLLLYILFGVVLGLGLVYALLAWLVRGPMRSNMQLLARVQVALLVLQFLLGMAANLFVKIPSYEPWRVFHEFGPILPHVINGTCLIIFAVLYLRLAVRARKLVGIGWTILVALVVAYASGTAFVNAGQNNWCSLSMAVAFIVALLAVGYSAFSPAAKIARKTR